MCLLDLFGGISTGLAAVLQAGVRVQRYLYVELDETSRRVSLRHVAQLHERYPDLLPLSAVRGYQHALSADIRLVSAKDFARVGPVHLVVAAWPCQGHSTAGRADGLHHPSSSLFWEMVRIIGEL